MPGVRDRTVATHSSTAWDFSWVLDALVVNLDIHNRVLIQVFEDNGYFAWEVPSRWEAVHADLSAAATEERQQRSIRSVLGFMQRQGEQDVRVEGVKGTLASSVSVQGLFKELDRSQKRYVTDIDLWNFVRGGGSSTSLRSITVSWSPFDAGALHLDLSCALNRIRACPHSILRP